MRIRLLRGCITRAAGRVDSLVTSTNRTLSGNGLESYWRFNGRDNVNGIVHAMGGTELYREICKIPLEGVERCKVGGAVVTPATGELTSISRHIVHCVAPDGMYGQESDPSTLRKTFEASFSAASSVGAESVAVPAVGCGVQGWPPAAAYRAAMGALEAHVTDQDVSDGSGDAKKGTSLRRVDFVLFDRHVWLVWLKLIEAGDSLGLDWTKLEQESPPRLKSAEGKPERYRPQYEWVLGAMD